MYFKTFFNFIRKNLILGRLHEDEATAGPSGVSQRKKARLDPLPNGSNVGANGSVNLPPGSLIGMFAYRISYTLLLWDCKIVIRV